MKKLTATLAGALVAGAIGFAFSQGAPYPGGFPGGGAPYPNTEQQTDKEKKTTSAIDLPPNVTPGWKIRVCSEKTKAQGIQFKFMQADQAGTGAPMKKKDEAAANPSEDFTAWTKGEATLIEVPTALRDVQRLRIEAAPATKDAEAQVCVLFNDHVTTQLKFDDREVSTVKSTEQGTCGC
jgi:hypothetical protein